MGRRSLCGSVGNMLRLISSTSISADGSVSFAVTASTTSRATLIGGESGSPTGTVTATNHAHATITGTLSVAK